MPKSHPSSSKKKQKVLAKAKKRKKSYTTTTKQPKDALLSNVCNITGLNDGAVTTGLDGTPGIGGIGIGGMMNNYGDGGIMGDNNIMDCLDELASAQVGVLPPSSSSVTPVSQNSSHDINTGSNGTSTTTTAKEIEVTPGNHPTSTTSPPSPPGLHQIPNIKIELARHLQTQTLSTFLLQSCSGTKKGSSSQGGGGLRMPTFERWLLDSKLEESDRFQSILQEWIRNPSLKTKLLTTTTITNDGNGKSKKKYGRAAMYEQQKNNNDDNATNAQYEREKSRKEKDCKLLLAAEKRIPAWVRSTVTTTANYGNVVIGSVIRHVDRDPVLPYHVMEHDPSCERLTKEIVAAMTVKSNGGEGLDDEGRILQRAREIVRDLCHRTTEACNELRHLETRLGKFQKFGWDTAPFTAADVAGGGRKKRKRGGGGSGGGGGKNVDKVLVEWHKEGEDASSSGVVESQLRSSSSSSSSHRQICSLVYVAKKRKSSRASSSAATDGTTAEGNKADDTSSSQQHKPKPFVIKINASHYHKLRTMFDATYSNSPTFSSTASTTKEQMTHAFHALLFAVVLRYSSLSGGQQLNDFRGGGMQGAVHDGVFDCLSKWFGKQSSSSSSSSDPSGTECFASPFNSALPRFFSAFPSPDIDGHFGSRGDFFHPSEEADFLHPGWYELNPPFSPAVMDKMAKRVCELLEMHSERGSDATFVVVIPTVRHLIANVNDELSAEKGKAKKKKKKKRKHKQSSSDHDADSQEDSNNNNGNNAKLMMSTVHRSASKSFHQLIINPHCKCHLILPPREHGYIEGGQHLCPTKFKESQYSTSVIVLGSKRGWMTGGADDDEKSFEKELREAFASRHAKEVAERKQEV